MKPVCLVLGAGRGIGANVGTYFADHGYHACLVRRSNQEALNESISLIQKAKLSYWISNECDRR